MTIDSFISQFKEKVTIGVVNDEMVIIDQPTLLTGDFKVTPSRVPNRDGQATYDFDIFTGIIDISDQPIGEVFAINYDWSVSASIS